MRLPLIKRRPSQGLLNNPPTTEPLTYGDAQSAALARSLLVPGVRPGLNDVYGGNDRRAAGQPLIKGRYAYSSSDDGKPTDTFPYNNVIAQEWYWQMLMPGSQGTIVGRRLGTKAVVPIGLQPIPRRGPAYQRTIHGVPLSVAFPTGGDPGS